jgi:hypothetical protein
VDLDAVDIHSRLIPETDKQIAGRNQRIVAAVDAGVRYADIASRFHVSPKSITPIYRTATGRDAPATRIKWPA